MTLDSLVREIKQRRKDGDITDRFSLWSWLANHISAKSLAEIGVWKGDFAEHLLKSVPAIECYYMIDPWAILPDWNKPFNKIKDFESIYKQAMQRLLFASEKTKTLRGRTIEMIHGIPDNSLDFAYIDGDHTLRGITIDLISILPKIKPGGFIGGDDFTKTPWQHSIEYEPTLVCPLAIYFAEAHRLPIAALGGNQFLIQNSNQAGFSFTDAYNSYNDLSLNKLPPGYGNK